MRRNKVMIAVGVVVLILIAVGGAWAWVGLKEPRQEDEAPVAGDSHVTVDPVDQDAQWAAVSVMVAGFSWEPAQDESTVEGFLRVSDQLTESFRGQLEQARGQEMGTKAMPPSWPVWASAGDQTTAVVSPQEVKVLEDHGVVSVEIDQSVRHVGGQSTPLSRMYADVAVVKGEGRWLVDSYEITEVVY